MSRIARNRPLQRSSIAEIDSDARNGSHRLPMQHEVLSQKLRYLLVAVKRGAKEAAVSATVFVGQFAEHAEAEHRLVFGFSELKSPVEIRVPEEA